MRTLGSSVFGEHEKGGCTYRKPELRVGAFNVELIVLGGNVSGVQAPGRLIRQ